MEGEPISEDTWIATADRHIDMERLFVALKGTYASWQYFIFEIDRLKIEGKAKGQALAVLARMGPLLDMVGKEK